MQPRNLTRIFFTHAAGMVCKGRQSLGADAGSGSEGRSASKVHVLRAAAQHFEDVLGHMSQQGEQAVQKQFKF